MTLNQIDFSDLTYNGLFNEYFFNYKRSENEKILSMDLSTARSVNPITDEMEYFINIGLLSKFDG